MLSSRVRVAAPLLAAALLALPASAQIEVNSFDDLPDFDLLDGVCDADPDTEGEQRTLRAAIMHAAGIIVEGGVVGVVLPAGTFKLKRKGAFEDAGAIGDLDVLVDMQIVGQGPGETIIVGNKAKDRIFHVHQGASLSLQGVTLRGGKAQKDDDGGGGILVEGALILTEAAVERCRSLDDGGGVELEDGATGVFTDVLFDRNSARDDGGGLDADDSVTTLNRVTFSRNKARDEGGGMEVSGGFASLINTTFSRNRAKDEGAAMSVEDFGEVEIFSSTFFGNRSKTDSALSTVDFADSVSLTNCILAGKGKKPNCNGLVFATGGNLESGDSCFGLIVETDANLGDTDPRLDKKLRDNGGATPTHALRPDSPAIDFAHEPDCPEFDQRGLPRFDHPDAAGPGACDAGSFELQESELP